MEHTKQHEERQTKNGIRPKKINLGFLEWTELENQSILVKKAYVDIAGGFLEDGIILSQIIYWHTPSKKDKCRLGVYRDDRFWLVRKYSDWWCECRVKERTARRALANLKNRGLIDVQAMKNGKTPQCHIALNVEKTEKLLCEHFAETLREDDDAPRKMARKRARRGQIGQIETADVAKLATSLHTITCFKETEICNADGQIRDKVPDCGTSSFLAVNRERMGAAIKELQTNPETSSYVKSKLDEAPEIVAYFFKKYFKRYCHAHPAVKREAWNSIIENLVTYTESWNYEDCIQLYFSDSNLRTNHRINHFATIGILIHRALDANKIDTGNGSLAWGCAS